MSELDVLQKLIKLPDEIRWVAPAGSPDRSVEQAVLVGDENTAGLYLVLMKWHPGYMSAPHRYATDRLCVVVSGIWWCNSGPEFDPDRAQPAPPGSFVRRFAGTPHYDGTQRDAPEPAIIAVTGVGPVHREWIDPSRPTLRTI
jgi:hypothetical protein